MAVDRRYRYVNGMRNIAWLAGFLRKKDGIYYVQQNNNVEQMIPLVVPPNFMMPAEFTPIEAACHIYAHRENDEQQCSLRVVDVSRPSIRAMPSYTTWTRGKNGKDDFKPFLSKSEIKRELVENVDKNEEATDAEKMVSEFFKSSGGKFDSRLGENANKVLIAGFTGATRFVPPNEHQEHGYGEVYLHQYAEPDRAIPVRVYNPGVMSILSSMRKGEPVAFNGQLRMKILPDDEGNIRHRSLHVRVEDVLVTMPGVDILDTPLWWADLFRAGLKEKKAKEASPVAPAALEQSTGSSSGAPIPSQVDDL